MGGEASVVIAGTFIKYLHLPKSERDRSFSVAFCLVGFFFRSVALEATLARAEVKGSYLAPA